MAIVEVHNTPILCWSCPCGWEFDLSDARGSDPYSAKEASAHEKDCGHRVRVAPSWRFPFIFVVDGHVLD